jgi:hypothetical protein
MLIQSVNEGADMHGMLIQSINEGVDMHVEQQ